FNRYTFERIKVILAKSRLNAYFMQDDDLEGITHVASRGDGNIIAGDDLEKSGKIRKFRILKEFKGSDLVGIKYEQLLPWALPYEDAVKALQVIVGDFVTTEDGTGIVHTAPTFGADDAKV